MKEVAGKPGDTADFRMLRLNSAPRSSVLSGLQEVKNSPKEVSQGHERSMTLADL